ncbi:HNH endonuclease family protein [Planococcus sp. SSTMD024]|uniref:HNH endonuclease family protein n=1 Tax=Planococcus sp. SSTMD024 TaxID=3242163 RepID=UPI00351F07F8
MRTIPMVKPISSILNRKAKINPKPQYQRGPVWNTEKKQQLIDTILRGYDIPKFYLRTTKGKYEHEVTDGQQRLRAIWEFYENKFPVGDYSTDLPEVGDLSGKYYKDLTGDEQDRLLSFTLSITEIDKATENEVRELFLRLQEGISLNPAEKRNAMVGKMRDFIASIAENKVFLKTNIENKRFEYDDWAAHVTCLELAGGPTNIKAIDLKKMYENNTSFESNGKTAKKVKKVLNYMVTVLNDKPPEINIKWGFVDLYLLVSVLIDDYDISSRHKDFHDFYVGFEKERREVSDPVDLISGHPSADQIDLFNYISAFQKEGANKKNIEVRHQVYKNRFLSSFDDLLPKDPKRRYNSDERLIIWRNADMRCENEKCNKVITIDEMHADHIVAHSKGGKTTIDNGQSLCVECNLKKSNNVL